jgi:hypothetical protein
MISQTRYLFVAMVLFLVVILIALIANPDLVTTFCSVDTGITSQVDEVLKEGSNLKSDDLQPKKVDDAEVQERPEPRETGINLSRMDIVKLLALAVFIFRVCVPGIVT